MVWLLFALAAHVSEMLPQNPSMIFTLFNGVEHRIKTWLGKACHFGKVYWPNFEAQLRHNRGTNESNVQNEAQPRNIDYFL